MPKGPQGQKRPADVIGAAVMVGKIATGEIEDAMGTKKAKSGKARAKALTPKQRAEIASLAAQARWKKKS